MGSLFRSEPMCLIQLFIQSETAHDTVSDLGEVRLRARRACLFFRPRFSTAFCSFARVICVVGEMFRACALLSARRSATSAGTDPVPRPEPGGQCLPAQLCARSAPLR